MLLGTVTEVASLGMVLPFLGAITAPERIFSHPWAQPFVVGMGLTDSQQMLLPLTILFGVAAVLSGATRLALLWGQTHLGNAIGRDLGAAAYRRTLYQPYSVHSSRNSSEVIAVLITKINTVVYFIIIPLLTLVTSLFLILTIVACMILVDPELTAVTFIGFGSMYAMVAIFFKSRVSGDSVNVTTCQNEVAQIIQEGLGGIREVLIDGLQEKYSRIFRSADGRLRLSLANIAFISGAPRPVIESLALVLIGILAYFLADSQEGIMTALPVLGAFVLAAQRLLPLVQQTYAGWSSILGGQATLKDVLALLEQPLPAHSTEPPGAPIGFTQTIELDNVHYRYNDRDAKVLRGISLQIPRGSRIGFIGTTGSGKSTLLDIIMGLLFPTAGSLLIDGTAITETNHRKWQAHIAHVPQMIYLADTSIAENIAFGVPPEDIDQELVLKAARNAQIADSIESWPAGYRTVVGERGVRISGGQRQRIGIARALYKEADVIVFDEATSALDSDTEHAVMESIKSLDREMTIIIVAHRLTTLKNCDQIVELREGTIHRVGSYQEMIGNLEKSPEFTDIA
ncbi:MAG: ABC transporter ATP-binding protein [Gammaproteobacteria bacterium]|nr:ABC transporter ATP-binding protein [Gammaproteobacteria bacterium]